MVLFVVLSVQVCVIIYLDLLICLHVFVRLSPKLEALNVRP